MGADPGVQPLDASAGGEPETGAAVEPAAEAGAGDAGALPDEGFTVAQIRAYADEHGIALPSSALKAELLAIVRGEV